VPDERPIYLDYNATTPCDSHVLDTMRPYFSKEFGNPASRTHAYGWRADEAVELARTQIGDLIGARPREVIFTSGATESNNLALFGAAHASEKRRRHIIVCATEHKSVLDPCGELERQGFQLTRVSVGRDGGIDMDALRGAIRSKTFLISVMHANNEIGVFQPLEEIGSLARAHGALFHTDAAQSVGKVPVDVARLRVDLLSLSGHKLYGPKGIGALYVRDRRPRIELRPLIHGGGHERGLRSGTLPVPLCVGLGQACELAGHEMEGEASRIRALRDRFWSQLQDGLEAVWLNGDLENRLPGNLNAGFLGVEANALLLALPDMAMSTGSACTSARPEASHVLRELGLRNDESLASIRIGIGRFTTPAEVDRAAGRIIEEVERLRALSPSWESRRRKGGARAGGRPQ
jgi:cysteine desulfurase